MIFAILLLLSVCAFVLMAWMNGAGLNAAYTPDEFHITPALSFIAGKCENPECGVTHAWRFAAQWLWWGASITWEVEEK